MEISWPEMKIVAPREATINVQNVLIGAIRTKRSVPLSGEWGTLT
jgi:hypothetical protein